MFDSHCHLDDDQYVTDLDQVLGRAREAGLSGVLIPATQLASSRKVLDLSARQPGFLFAGVGVHPHEAATWSPKVEEQLKVLLGRPREQAGPVALGEIGLDYHYDFCPRPVQREVFRLQIRLAKGLGLPLVIHTREAAEDTRKIMDEEEAWRCGGVMHCYSGTMEEAQPYLEGGFYLGVTGALTFPKAGPLEELVQSCPRERLLIETDGPYLAPVPHRGQRNEPAHVALVAARVAELWGLSPEEAARLTEANARRCFRLPEPAAGGIN